MCKQISLCGDGQPASDETCDDGNTRGDDGCSSDCQTIEPGWVCRIAGKPCAPRCGDGRLLGTEDCDDGNSESGDGCSRFCRKEPGAFCPQPGKLCEIAVCGSSGHDGGVCDAGSAIVPTCGDGIPSPDEECDQGSGNDDLAYGGCTSACVLGPHCGDGIVNGPAETCDRGADKPDIVSSYGKKDTCTATCLATPYCGDGVVDVMFGEECDLGDSKNGAPGSPCDLACHVILG